MGALDEDGENIPAVVVGAMVLMWENCTETAGESPQEPPVSLPVQVIKWSQLTEINAGLMDSLTYENVAEQMPEEYEARKRDKLRYRCASVT